MRRTSSREVHRDAWMVVREDEVVREDGSVGTYGVVDKPDFALVVPVEPDGDLWVVEQHRYAVGRRVWEFPQGSWPQGVRGTPEELARAELREETGLEATTLRHVGRVAVAAGFCSQACDVFVARGLTPGPPQREASERDMRHARVGREEFAAMVADGRVVDAASLAACALAGVPLGRR